MIKGIRKEAYNCEAYVSGKSMDDVMEEYGLTQVMKLGSNENPYGPYEKCKEAMAAEIGKINVYPEKNYIKLKKLLGEKFGVDSDCVSLGHGAGNVLDEIAKTFLEEGDEVIVPQQSYRLYREISKIMGAKVIEVSLDENYTINLDDFKAAITPKTKLIWVCNPNNPTGSVIPKENFDAFIYALPEQTWLVVDEAYAEFADQEMLPDLVKHINANKNVIIVRTFSKYYGIAGARMGYLISSPEVITMYDTVSEPFNANRVALAGAVELVENEQETCKKYADIMIHDREMMNKELEKMGCTPYTSHANFIFFRTPFEASVIGELLLRKGLIVRPCSGWGYHNHLRVSIGTTEQNQVFLKEMKEILSSLKKEQH